MSGDPGRARNDPPAIMHPSGGQLIISRGLDEWTERAADLFVTLAQKAADVEGARFTVALSGGSTPKRLYSALAAAPYVDEVPWARVHLFWGDERHVGPDDAESNYRMVRESLIEKAPIPAENVHRIRAETPDAAEAARAYALDIQGFFGLQPDEWPRFDLVLLGLGPDGHTASLFPGVDALHDTTHIVVAPFVPKFNTDRISLTAPAINAAATVAFLVAGEEKSGVLRDVLEGPRQPDLFPAQIVAPANGDLLWLLDEGAASQLKTRPS